MNFKEKLKRKERFVYWLAIARVWSEVMIVIGFLIILYLIIRQFI